MNRPDQVPEEVADSVTRWSENHGVKLVPTLQWDAMNGCYFFWSSGMYHGVELDGHIHT